LSKKKHENMSPVKEFFDDPSEEKTKASHASSNSNSLKKKSVRFYIFIVFSIFVIIKTNVHF